jgi:hypothetical protein
MLRAWVRACVCDVTPGSSSSSSVLTQVLTASAAAARLTWPTDRGQQPTATQSASTDIQESYSRSIFAVRVKKITTSYILDYTAFQLQQTVHSWLALQRYRPARRKLVALDLSKTFFEKDEMSTITVSAPSAGLFLLSYPKIYRPQPQDFQTTTVNITRLI